MKYLEAAVEHCDSFPEDLITFRSKVAWVTVQKALKKSDSHTIPIYFSPGRDGGVVEFEATLHTVILNPTLGDKITENFLNHQLPATASEGLWDNKVKTLYVITRCRKLHQSFQMTELLKFSDEQNISKDYIRAYAIVRPHNLISGPNFFLNPEEIQPKQIYTDGQIRKVSVNVYERDVRARKKCIEHYGACCSVCGFDFRKEFGELGKGFIHVHHIEPLSKTIGISVIDPVEDLRPVCPNCHSMLHREGEILSIEELKDIRREANKANSANAKSRVAD